MGWREDVMRVPEYLVEVMLESVPRVVLFRAISFGSGR